jgi:hypothetical protein
VLQDVRVCILEIYIPPMELGGCGTGSIGSCYLGGKYEKREQKRKESVKETGRWRKVKGKLNLKG